MFSIVGPDGAGKTTTIRMLCGITEPTSGDGKILGFDLIKQTEEIKERIGYLSQRFSLYGDLTVDENIEFFAEIHGVGDYKKRRDELLEFTRLKPFRKRLGEKLSGVMKQKLALACTLVHTPEIIFLDEPTTGVDPISRRDFWKILSDLLKTGITIVMTTPYLDEAERCSRVGMMNRGKMLVVNRPQEIKKLMNGKVIEVITNDIRKGYSIIRSDPDVLEVQAFGDRLNIVVKKNEDHENGIRSRITREGAVIEDWREITPSLENVFISLLRKT
jgi:ABC-2 type transport system ATP-binding protein